MKTLKFVPLLAAALIIFGCQPAVSPTPPATPPPAAVSPPLSPVPADGKKVACNTNADCVPDPSMCHPHSCITKTGAEGMQKVEMCTMLFDYQAAYSAEDCACELGKCVNKNLGRTSDAPEVI